MLANVTIGYGLAWACRWRLVPVLVPVLVPLLLVLLAVDVVTTGSDASIVGGSIAFAGREGDPLAWAVLALIALCWLVTVTAATAVAVGAKVGRAVGPSQAFALAAKRLPYLGLGLIFAAGGGLIAVFVAGSAAAAMGAQLGPVMFLAAFAVLALLGARLLFTFPAALFGGSAWHITRGKVLRTAGAVLLGGIVIPFIVAAGVDAIPLPVGAELAETLLLVAAVAVQAGILAHVYVDEHPAADIDGYLGHTEPGPSRPLISLGLLMPALAMATIIVGNPYHVPRVDAGGNGPPGGAEVLAWPAGLQPILISTTAVRFCANPQCTEVVLRNGGPGVMDGWGVAGIGASGTVIKAALTGGADNGGPFIHFGQCTRDGDCRTETWIPTRASSDEPFAWPELAVSVAPDGALIFALAQSTQAAMTKPNTDGQVEFKFIRCADVRCAQPQRFSAGRIKGALHNGPRSGKRVHLRIGPDGRPVASFWIGHTIQTVTCDPVTCANPRITAASAGPADAPWTLLGTTAVWLNLGGLHSSEGLIRQLAPAGFSAHAQAIATSETGIYAALAVKAPQPAGFRVTFGKQPEYWQYVVWHCPDIACASPRRIPLDVVKGSPQPVKLAIGRDGSVLLVREDRILLMPPSQS